MKSQWKIVDDHWFRDKKMLRHEHCNVAGEWQRANRLQGHFKRAWYCALCKERAPEDMSFCADLARCVPRINP